VHLTVFCLSLHLVDAAGSSSRQRQIQHDGASCLGNGSVRSAANAIASGLRAATSSARPFATGRQRAEVSPQLVQFDRYLPAVLFLLLL